MLRRFFKAIFGNFGRSLVAFVVALAIWFYANAKVTTEVDLKADILIEPPPDHSVVYQSEKELHVRLSGPDHLVSKVRGQTAQGRARLTHAIEAADLKNGWAVLDIDPEWLQLDLLEREFVQLRFENIGPKQVEVFVSPVVERVLPVEPRRSGEPPEGFQLERPLEAVPPTVRVTGPAVALDSLEQIPTEREVRLWDARGRSSTESYALKRTVDVTLANGQKVPVALKLSEDSVKVTILLAEKAREKAAFADLILAFRVVPGWPYAAEMDEGAGTCSVTVEAAPEVLRRLKPESIRPYVDLTALPDEPIAPGASAPYQERIWVDLPRDLPIASYSVQPERVTILLKNPAR